MLLTVVGELTSVSGGEMDRQTDRQTITIAHYGIRIRVKNQIKNIFIVFIFHIS